MKYLDQSAPIRKGEELKLESLEQYLQEQLHSKEKLVVEQFPRGFSNLTYLIRLGDQQMVLRRPPFGAKIKSAHDMSREYRILSHLSKVYHKVPKTHLYCEDESIIGADFYVMERIQGVILRPKMPKEMLPNATTMNGIAHSLVNTFAELHAIDYQAAGLGDLGRPEGYVERQIKGWTKRYFNAKTDEWPMLEKAAQWLEDNRPQESSASLIHNDFKYDNLILNGSDWTEVIAILDWEMSTIGDPLMDLGTSIGYWITDKDPEVLQQMRLSPTNIPGNPNRTELVEWYVQKSGRDVGNMVFYYAYGMFKIAVILQQIYYRYHKGFTQDARFAKLNEVVNLCGMMAMRAIEKKRIDDLF